MDTDTSKSEPVVDGYSDTNAPETEVDSPDPGRSQKAPKPLDAEEYERLKEEAREQEPPNHPGQ